ncbi:MAG TPA: cytochrome P450 [Deltaproteobacteria bacterium]|jgi:cholest-4-en-3-one 26-monooxygenase|nr:cytochrome P450 [Deltaproteobacteria bacterium]
MATAQIDLFDPTTFERGVPHEFFAWLQEHSPVHWHPGRKGRGQLAPGRIEIDQRGFWVLTRHQHVLEVSKDPELFSSERGTCLNADLVEADLRLMQQQLIHMDPPRHTQLRKLVSRGFTPRTIGRLEVHVRELAREIVDKVAPKGECDFVTEVAAELPLLVIAELLGVPREDRWKLFRWSNCLIGAEDPDYGNPMDAQIAVMELFQYAMALAEKRRREPRDDITSTLVHGEVDGERLSTLEYNMFFFLLVIAGNETTRNAISGGMRALCEFPEERARLLARRELLETAVDEMVRWVSPVMQFRRTATRDTELEGQRIAEGDKVVMFYGAANRDRRAFPDPHRFDVAREPNPHLGFGFGVHFCLGASLARMEMRCMIEELLRRLPDLELAGPVARLRSNFINGIKSMPVRFTPEKGRS